MPYPLTNYKTPSPGLFILCVHLVYAYMPHVCLYATYVHCLQKQEDIRSSETELHVIELTSVGAESKDMSSASIRTSWAIFQPLFSLCCISDTLLNA